MVRKALRRSDFGSGKMKPPLPAASKGSTQKIRAYLSWVEMLVNLSFKVDPSVLTIAMMATEMPAAIRPYSIAVAPELVLQKRNKFGHGHTPVWFCYAAMVVGSS